MNRSVITTRTNSEQNKHTHDSTPHPQPSGREDRKMPQTSAPSSPTLCHAEDAVRCRPAAPWAPPPRGCPQAAQTWSSIHLYRWSFNTHSNHSIRATIQPDHSAWGARLIHRLSSLPRTQISKTEWEHLLRPPPTPSSPLHHERHHKANKHSWALYTLTAVGLIGPWAI
jgi:hypothetical protein